MGILLVKPVLIIIKGSVLDDTAQAEVTQEEQATLTRNHFYRRDKDQPVLSSTWRILLDLSFTACMLLLMVFGLGR